MRSDEPEEGRDGRFEAVHLRIGGAEIFGDAFGRAIGGGGVGGERRAGVVFGDMGKLGRLFAVDGAGAGEEQTPDAGGAREIKHAARGRDIAIERAGRMFGVGRDGMPGGGVAAGSVPLAIRAKGTTRLRR